MNGSTLVSHHGERRDWLSYEEGSNGRIGTSTLGGGGGGGFQGGDLLFGSNQLCDFLHGLPDLSIYGGGLGLGIGEQSSLVPPGLESSGQSVTSTPSWADLLSLGGVDNCLSGQMIPSFEVSGLDVDAAGSTSGALDTSVALDGLDDVITDGGGYHGLNPMLTTGYQNGKH